MTEKKSNDLKALVKVCILACIMVVCLFLVYATPLHNYLRLDRFEEYRKALQRSGAAGVAVFLGLGSFLVGVGFPRIAYHAAGGAAYGFAKGALYSHIGTMVGTMCCFWVARHLGREWVARKWGARFARLEHKLQERGFVILLLIRFSPIGNCFITTCLSAISSMRTSSFFLGSLIGLLPQTLIYSLLGSGLAKSAHHQTGISIGLLVCTSIVFFLYYRFSRLGSSVAEDLSNGPDSSNQSSLSPVVSAEPEKLSEL